MTKEQTNSWEEYIKALKLIITLGKTGCCPGCGITPKALEQVISQEKEKWVENKKKDGLDMKIAQELEEKIDEILYGLDYNTGSQIEAFLELFSQQRQELLEEVWEIILKHKDMTVPIDKIIRCLETDLKEKGLYVPEETQDIKELSNEILNKYEKTFTDLAKHDREEIQKEEYCDCEEYKKGVTFLPCPTHTNEEIQEDITTQKGEFTDVIIRGWNQKPPEDFKSWSN